MFAVSYGVHHSIKLEYVEQQIEELKSQITDLPEILLSEAFARNVLKYTWFGGKVFQKYLTLFDQVLELKDEVNAVPKYVELWDHPHLEALYDVICHHFDINERKANINSSLNFIETQIGFLKTAAGTIHSFLCLLQSSKHQLEEHKMFFWDIMIVLLIVVGLVIKLVTYEPLIRLLQ
jgi:uncharacterized Rmd1/YagE family protein